MQISIRKFEKSDVPNKIAWINDPRNNQYLHFDLPLEAEKTYRWFESVKDRTDRFDAVILADGEPCGIVGLLNIDRKNRKAEFYVTLGVPELRGCGAAESAGRLVLRHAFEDLELDRVYLYTETDNIHAQHLFERIGFRKEGCLREDVFSHGKPADRFVYGLLAEEFRSTES